MIALDRARMRAFIVLAETLRVRLIADPAFRVRVDNGIACVPFVLACGAEALALWPTDLTHPTDEPDVMVWAMTESNVFDAFDCAGCCLWTFGPDSALVAATLRDIAGLPDLNAVRRVRRQDLRHDPVGARDGR